MGEGTDGRGDNNPSPKGPLPFRELLTFPVIISISNYVALAFLNTTHLALLPLFFAMPISIGGLGLTPPKIGLILSAYGITSGVFQIFFFARLIRRFGEKRVFIVGLATCLPIFALFPVMSIIAQKSGLSLVMWILIGCVLALSALMETSFGQLCFTPHIYLRVVADKHARRYFPARYCFCPEEQQRNGKWLGADIRRISQSPRTGHVDIIVFPVRAAQSTGRALGLLHLFRPLDILPYSRGSPSQRNLGRYRVNRALNKTRIVARTVQLKIANGVFTHLITAVATYGIT